MAKVHKTLSSESQEVVQGRRGEQQSVNLVLPVGTVVTEVVIEECLCFWGILFT